MPAVDQELQELVASIREGSEDAVWRLIEIYGPHIRRVVRRHLDRRLRSRFDSIDFVQAVWASFFREPIQTRSFSSPDDIIGYLANTARNKVIDESRRNLSGRYDVRKERSFEESRHETEEAAAPQPGPHEVAIVREAWNQLLERQPAAHQEVVRLRLAGASDSDIAARLDMHERSVRKVVDRILEQLMTRRSA
jgi:RNA polymerase sigma-70 factor (ECF subfamily)